MLQQLPWLIVIGALLAYMGYTRWLDNRDRQAQRQDEAVLRHEKLAELDKQRLHNLEIQRLQTEAWKNQYGGHVEGLQAETVPVGNWKPHDLGFGEGG